MHKNFFYVLHKKDRPGFVAFDEKPWACPCAVSRWLIQVGQPLIERNVRGLSCPLSGYTLTIPHGGRGQGNGGRPVTCRCTYHGGRACGHLSCRRCSGWTAEAVQRYGASEDTEAIGTLPIRSSCVTPHYNPKEAAMSSASAWRAAAASSAALRSPGTSTASGIAAAACANTLHLPM